MVVSMSSFSSFPASAATDALSFESALTDVGGTVSLPQVGKAKKYEKRNTRQVSGGGKCFKEAHVKGKST